MMKVITVVIEVASKIHALEYRNGLELKRETGEREKWVRVYTCVSCFPGYLCQRVSDRVRITYYLILAFIHSFIYIPNRPNCNKLAYTFIPPRLPLPSIPSTKNPRSEHEHTHLGIESQTSPSLPLPLLPSSLSLLLQYPATLLQLHNEPWIHSVEVTAKENGPPQDLSPPENRENQRYRCRLLTGLPLARQPCLSDEKGKERKK